MFSLGFGFSGFRVLVVQVPIWGLRVNETLTNH